MKNQLHQAKEQAEITTDHAEKVYKTKEENFQKRFRKETKVNEEDLTVVKEQYSKAQDKIIKDLQETEKKLRQTMEHSELVDQRRITENTAFQSDIATLKQKVQEYERFIKMLKELVDQEETG